MQLFQALLKVADTSNEARPAGVARPWASSLLEEFFRQVCPPPPPSFTFELSCCARTRCDLHLALSLISHDVLFICSYSHTYYHLMITKNFVDDFHVHTVSFKVSYLCKNVL